MLQFKILVVSFFLFLNCDGFLLDDRTQSPHTTGQAMTNKHFYMLMDLLTEERNARLKQNTKISQLEKELIATQQGVMTNFHASNSVNDTLKTVLDITEENMRKMVSNYSNLQNEYYLVKAELNELKLNNSRINQYVSLLEQEFLSVKQLKSVANLKTILNLTEDVKHLEHELNFTNNIMSSIANDVIARQQDFVVLLNKTDLIDERVELAMKSIKTNCTSTHRPTNDSLNKSYPNFESRFQMLENLQNVSKEKLEKEIHSMSDRVAVTACANDQFYTGSENVQFPHVYTNLGVAYSVLFSMKTNGTFKCEKPGLYFVSSYITANVNGHYFLVKNTSVIGHGYSSVNGDYTTSTIVNLVFLSKHDSLSIKNGNGKHILGNLYSCISILQLTG